MEQKNTNNRVIIGTIGHTDCHKTSLEEAISRYLQKGDIVSEKESIISPLQKANGIIKTIDTLDEELKVDKKPIVRKRTHHKKR